MIHVYEIAYKTISFNLRNNHYKNIINDILLILLNQLNEIKIPNSCQIQF